MSNKDEVKINEVYRDTAGNQVTTVEVIRYATTNRLRAIRYRGSTPEVKVIMYVEWQSRGFKPVYDDTVDSRMATTRTIQGCILKKGRGRLLDI